jgi:hypothetical protein
MLTIVFFMLSVAAFAEDTNAVGIQNNPANNVGVGIQNDPSNTNQAQALALINQFFPTTTIVNNGGTSGSGGSSNGLTYKPINFAMVKTTLGEVQTGPCSRVQVLGVANEPNGKGKIIAITNTGTATADITGWRPEDDSGLVIGDRVIRGKTLPQDGVYLFRHVMVPADGTIVHIMSAETINYQGEVTRKYVDTQTDETFFLGSWNQIPNLASILIHLQDTGIGSSKWYLDFNSNY